MTYPILKFVHILGAILIGAGLIGVWISDLRSRQVRDLVSFSEAVRNIAIFYDGVVVPGSLLVLISGGWLIAGFHGGQKAIGVPWLAAMVGLFLFEFVEGNTVTRTYFMRLRRHTKDGLRQNRITPELEKARGKHIPTFTHFLDLPVFFLIVALGVVRPATWTPFLAGLVAAMGLAAALTWYVPRLYPWGNAVSLRD